MKISKLISAIKSRIFIFCTDGACPVSTLIIFLVFIFFFAPSVFAQSISNGNFENERTDWNSTNANLIIAFPDSNPHEGSRSAYLTNTSSTSYGLEQTVKNITPSQGYKISGYIKIAEPPPVKSFIRVAWYESSDGSGPQLMTQDSETLATQSDWKDMSYIVTAPANAHSVKIRVLVSAGSAFFDSIRFEAYSEPSPTGIINQTTPSVTDTLLPTVPPTPPTTAAPTYSNIYISEAMVNPITGESEWIELYNANDYLVVLSDWYLDDISEGGSPLKKFSLVINAKSFGVINITSAMFNNDADTVRLLDNLQQEKNSAAYTYSQKYYSLGRTSFSDDNLCLQYATKGLTNNSCAVTDDEEITSGLTQPMKMPTNIITKKSTTAPLAKIPSDSTNEFYKRYNTSANFLTAPTASASILGVSSEIILPVQKTDSLISTLTLLAPSYCLLALVSVVTKTAFRKNILTA